VITHPFEEDIIDYTAHYLNNIPFIQEWTTKFDWNWPPGSGEEVLKDVSQK
jgi:hypothetical protein